MGCNFDVLNALFQIMVTLFFVHEFKKKTNLIFPMHSLVCRVTTNKLRNVPRIVESVNRGLFILLGGSIGVALTFVKILLFSIIIIILYL